MPSKESSIKSTSHDICNSTQRAPANIHCQTSTADISDGRSPGSKDTSADAQVFVSSLYKRLVASAAEGSPTPTSFRLPQQSTATPSPLPPSSCGSNTPGSSVKLRARTYEAAIPPSSSKGISPANADGSTNFLHMLRKLTMEADAAAEDHSASKQKQQDSSSLDHRRASTQHPEQQRHQQHQPVMSSQALQAAPLQIPDDFDIYQGLDLAASFDPTSSQDLGCPEPGCGPLSLASLFNINSSQHQSSFLDSPRVRAGDQQQQGTSQQPDDSPNDQPCSAKHTSGIPSLMMLNMQAYRSTSDDAHACDGLHLLQQPFQQQLHQQQPAQQAHNSSMCTANSEGDDALRRVKHMQHLAQQHAAAYKASQSQPRPSSALLQAPDADADADVAQQQVQADQLGSCPLQTAQQPEVPMFAAQLLPFDMMRGSIEELQQLQKASLGDVVALPSVPANWRVISSISNSTVEMLLRHAGRMPRATVEGMGGTSKVLLLQDAWVNGQCQRLVLKVRLRPAVHMIVTLTVPFAHPADKSESVCLSVMCSSSRDSSNRHPSITVINHCSCCR